MNTVLSNIYLHVLSSDLQYLQSELNSKNLFYRNLKIESKHKQQKVFLETKNNQSQGNTWHLGTYHF